MLRWLVCAAFVLAAVPASGGTLQIDTPYQSSGTNTGTVGPASLSATSTHWAADFGDESSIYGSSLFGALALPAGTLGDFFRINLGASARSDRFAITFSDPVQDPILYLIDLQGTGGRVTVGPGGTAFTSDADASWSGDVLTVTNGYPSGSAFAAVRYGGSFAAGSVFTLEFDYGAVPSSLQLDTIGIAIATPVPEPPASAGLLLVAASLAILRARLATRPS